MYLEGISSRAGDNEIMTKRMELFHYEFQHEQQQYRQQKKKEDDEKLDAIMKYTLTTFKRLNFGETEIFQICECVRYFVTNRQVLTTTEIHIKKRTSVTQISLKNFAWNIAFQYNISGDVTANSSCIHSMNGLPTPPLTPLGRICARLQDDTKLK